MKFQIFCSLPFDSKLNCSLSVSLRQYSGPHLSRFRLLGMANIWAWDVWWNGLAVNEQVSADGTILGEAIASQVRIFLKLLTDWAICPSRRWMCRFPFFLLGHLERLSFQMAFRYIRIPTLLIFGSREWKFRGLDLSSSALLSLSFVPFCLYQCIDSSVEVDCNPNRIWEIKKKPIFKNSQSNTVMRIGVFPRFPGISSFNSDRPQKRIVIESWCRSRYVHRSRKWGVFDYFLKKFSTLCSVLSFQCGFWLHQCLFRFQHHEDFSVGMELKRFWLSLKGRFASSMGWRGTQAGPRRAPKVHRQGPIRRTPFPQPRNKPSNPRCCRILTCHRCETLSR